MEYLTHRLKKKMKSDVTEKVRNMVASNLQDGYVFSPDEFAVQDPTSGNLLLYSYVFVDIEMSREVRMSFKK